MLRQLGWEAQPAWVEGSEVVGEVVLQHCSLVLRLAVCWAETLEIYQTDVKRSSASTQSCKCCPIGIQLQCSEWRCQ